MKKRETRWRVCSPLLTMMILFATLSCLPAQSCGGVTSQDVQQGIDVAADVLSVLTTVLKPAVDSSKKLCSQLLVEGSPNRETALIDCLKINDAWNHVVDMNDKFQDAVVLGNKAKGEQERSEAKTAVDKALADLKQSVEELKDVLAKSELTSGAAP